jgi:hypothetical protein
VARTHNLFISHSWSYHDAYDRLVGLLDDRGYFPYRNHSVPKDDPVHTRGSDRALADAIQRKIAPCHVVIIMAGVYSTYSRWILKEIAIAQKAFSVRKPIIAVRPRGAQRLSEPVVDAADRVVGWHTESIVAAIRELSR